MHKTYVHVVKLYDLYLKVFVGVVYLWWRRSGKEEVISHAEEMVVRGDRVILININMSLQHILELHPVLGN